jgi:hypothetical protein
MKRFFMFTVLMVLIVGIALASGDGERGRNIDNPSYGQGRGQGRGSTTAGRGGGFGNGQPSDERFTESLAEMISELELSDLNDSEAEGLIFMFEEEKLARDVYATLYEIWNYPIFANIGGSEQQHMDALAMLLTRYELPMPMTATAPGEFESEKLQSVYDELVATGKNSLVDALSVGATVEDLDIADLLGYIDDTDSDDLAVVYQNLLKGSRNHLRSFSAQLERQDVIYDATYITEAYLTRILSSEREAATITAPDFEF